MNQLQFLHQDIQNRKVEIYILIYFHEYEIIRSRSIEQLKINRLRPFLKSIKIFQKTVTVVRFFVLLNIKLIIISSK